MKKLLTISALTLVTIASTNVKAEEYCREYTKTLTIGNEIQEGFGTACLQPDGSWRIVSEESVKIQEQQQKVVTNIIPGTPQYIIANPRPYYEPRRTVYTSFGIGNSYRHHRNPVSVGFGYGFHTPYYNKPYYYKPYGYGYKNHHYGYHKPYKHHWWR